MKHAARHNSRKRRKRKNLKEVIVRARVSWALKDTVIFYLPNVTSSGQREAESVLVRDALGEYFKNHRVEIRERPKLRFEYFAKRKIDIGKRSLNRAP